VRGRQRGGRCALEGASFRERACVFHERWTSSIRGRGVNVDVAFDRSTTRGWDRVVRSSLPERFDRRDDRFSRASRVNARSRSVERSPTRATARKVYVNRDRSCASREQRGLIRRTSARRAGGRGWILFRVKGAGGRSDRPF